MLDGRSLIKGCYSLLGAPAITDIEGLTRRPSCIHLFQLVTFISKLSIQSKMAQRRV